MPSVTEKPNESSNLSETTGYGACMLAAVLTGEDSSDAQRWRLLEGTPPLSNLEASGGAMRKHIKN